MKGILAIIPLLVGCTVTNVSGPGWTLHRTSFLQQVSAMEVTISSNGTATLKGYGNDGGVQTVAIITAAAVEAGVKAAK